jgi:excisionase family DNA binding protein
MSLFTVREAGELLGIHLKTLYRWKSSGKIPYVVVNGCVRFERNKIDEFLEERRSLPIIPPPPKICLDLASFDRLHLKSKGGCAVSKETRRSWNYGIGRVFLRQGKNGDRWCIDYRNGERKRIREAVKSARTRGEVVSALQRRVNEVFESKFNPSRKPQRLTFADFSKMFIDGYAKTQKTSWQTDEFRLRKIKPFFEGVAVTEIDEAKILDLRQDRLGQGIGRLTVNREVALLKKMFSWAVEKGLVKENSARKVKMFSEKDTARDRVLSPEEEERLFGELPGPLQGFIFTALHTGLRLGELLGLAWTSVDFERKRIKLERTKSKRVRFVGLNSALAAELESLKQTQQEKTRLVFPFRRRTVRTGFENACRKAKIDGFTFHDLRRTFGTRLLEKGVNIVTISRLYGHSSVLVTQNYLHPGDEVAQEAVELLVAPKKPETMAQIWHAERERADRIPATRDFSVN